MQKLYLPDFSLNRSDFNGVDRANTTETTPAGSCHSPWVVQHGGGEVLTGLGQVAHGQAERGQKAALEQTQGRAVTSCGKVTAYRLPLLGRGSEGPLPPRAHTTVSSGDGSCGSQAS